jgi:hypothetical protein
MQDLTISGELVMHVDISSTVLEADGLTAPRQGVAAEIEDGVLELYDWESDFAESEDLTEKNQENTCI